MDRVGETMKRHEISWIAIAAWCIFAFTIAAFAVAVGQAQPLEISLDGTQQVARDLGIELEIVGRDHPEALDLSGDDCQQHGSLRVCWQDATIVDVTLAGGEYHISSVLVFYRRWRDEATKDARAIGCQSTMAGRLYLAAGFDCFAKIAAKMEGGLGPVLVEQRFYSMGALMGTLPLNGVTIPWSYVKSYAKMGAAEETRSTSVQ